MLLDKITKEVVECTCFTRPVVNRHTGEQTSEVVPCSATYTNQALRTLKAMLGKAEEWSLLDKVPKITALKHPDTSILVDAVNQRNATKLAH